MKHITYLILAFAWLAGIALAVAKHDEYWVVFSIICPPAAYYLVVVKLMTAYGWI